MLCILQIWMKPIVREIAAIVREIAPIVREITRHIKHIFSLWFMTRFCEGVCTHFPVWAMPGSRAKYNPWTDEVELGAW